MLASLNFVIKREKNRFSVDGQSNITEERIKVRLFADFLPYFSLQRNSRSMNVLLIIIYGMFNFVALG